MNKKYKIKDLEGYKKSATNYFKLGSYQKHITLLKGGEINLTKTPSTAMSKFIEEKNKKGGKK